MENRLPSSWLKEFNKLTKCCPLVQERTKGVTDTQMGGLVDAPFCSRNALCVKSDILKSGLSVCCTTQCYIINAAFYSVFTTAQS